MISRNRSWARQLLSAVCPIFPSPSEILFVSFVALQWVAPSEKDSSNDLLEKRLWDAADQLRANSGLNPQQYSGPVLGLIFLRFAEVRFAKRRADVAI
jgi:hypothetical protein